MSLTKPVDDLTVPTVLVVGDFRAGEIQPSIGFANNAWSKIVTEYTATGESFGPPPAVGTPVEAINMARYTTAAEMPSVFPLPVNDFGKALGATFDRYLYALLKRFNVVGVISCATAESNIGLASA